MDLAILIFNIFGATFFYFYFCIVAQPNWNKKLLDIYIFNNNNTYYFQHFFVYNPQLKYDLVLY